MTVQSLALSEYSVPPDAAIACLLTGPGKSAIATIAVCGTEAESILMRNLRLSTVKPLRTRQVRYAQWHGGTGDAGCASDATESVVVVLCNGPYQEKQNVVHECDSDVTLIEIHCHGGDAAAARILSDLRRCGIQTVTQSQWQQRFDVPLWKQEAIDALTKATTTRMAAVGLDQVRGAMPKFVETASDLLRDNQDDLTAVQSLAKDLLRFKAIGLRLVRGWRVVLVGPPNVGKSSLVNALLGFQRSITFDQPGTTRDVLNAHLVLDGIPMMLSDTAGMREDPAEQIEQEGIARARDVMSQADLIIWVSDATQALSETATIDDWYAPRPQQTQLRILNKCDLIDRATNLASPQPSSVGSDIIYTSASTGLGMDRLKTAIMDALVPSFPSAGQAVPLNERQARWLHVLVDARGVESARQALHHLLHG